jgi:ABC-type phosphate/phosphonate transport system substrate-binding protein
MLIANARMYSVNATVAAAWRTLLEWVIARSGVSGRVIDYAAPQPLAGLWSRPDMGAVFMCGYPLVHTSPRPIVLAAPIPSAPAYGGKAVYWTDIVVRAESPLVQFAETFGRRMAWTIEDSQSGYQALRAYCAPHAAARGGRLFAALVGPLVTPRRVIAAVLDGTADAGPLDSYFHDLVRHTEPYVAARLRTIASTPPTPNPMLVAAAGTPAADVERLRDALIAVADAPELATVRTTLALQGFARRDIADYDVLVKRAAAADAAGYPRLA